MIRLISAAAAVSLSLSGSIASAQVFDNAGVVKLHEAGLGDQTIVTKIATMPCAYDVSVDGLISLKKHGISDPIISAMVDRCTSSGRAQGLDSNSADPSAPHAPGIYTMVDWINPSQMMLMRPSKASGVKVSGNGSILFPFVGRLILPDSSSRTIVKSSKPTFYFYFKPDDGKVSDFGTPNSVAAQSPEEFTLVRFRVKGNERDVGVGKITAYSARRGIETKDSISFTSEEVGDSSFKVSVAKPLVPGEYGFVLTGQNNASRVYDFTVQG